MATKNEDQTKYSHLSKVLENVKTNPYIILKINPKNLNHGKNMYK
jgi:flagellar biosynthesis/type III secretory pathway protein FliH